MTNDVVSSTVKAYHGIEYGGMLVGIQLEQKFFHFVSS